MRYRAILRDIARYCAISRDIARYLCDLVRCWFRMQSCAILCNIARYSAILHAILCVTFILKNIAEIFYDIFPTIRYDTLPRIVEYRIVSYLRYYDTIRYSTIFTIFSCLYSIVWFSK